MRVQGLTAGALALGILICAAPPLRADAPLRVSVDGRALIVTGPKGYCVDRTGAKVGADSAVVVLGSCAALGGGRAMPDGPVAILTASIAFGDRGATAAPLLDRLESFLPTEAGRAALSRAGAAETVRLVAVERVGEALFLGVEDRAPGGFAGAQPVYWRAMLVLRGRLVTLSAMSPGGAEGLGPEQLRTVLAAFVARMAEVNRRQGS